MRVSAGLAVLLVGLGLGACGDERHPPGAYVGLLGDDDGDTSVALVIDGSRVAGYVCSQELGEEYDGWFVAELDDPTASAIEIERDGWVLQARWTEFGAVG